MLQVIKVLNTSVVLALEDGITQVVVMGKGIGFRQSIGSVLELSDADKVFVLKDRTLSRNIIRLAADLDAAVFEIAKDAIDYAKEKFGMKLMDHIYLALTDHLAFAIKRAEEDMALPNFYSTEVRRFNPEEYAVACYTLKLVRSKTGLELPEGETSNIAFHFINAQREHPQNKNNLRIESFVNNILDIVRYTFQIDYQKDSITYSRFLSHLQAFAQRLVLRQQLPEETDLFLYNEVITAYSREFSCVKKIAQFLSNQHGMSLCNQEMLYLVMHIHRVLTEEDTAAKRSAAEMDG